MRASTGIQRINIGAIILMGIMLVGLIVRLIWFKYDDNGLVDDKDNIDEWEKQFEIADSIMTETLSERTNDQTKAGKELRIATYRANNPGVTQQEAEDAMKKELDRRN